MADKELLSALMDGESVDEALILELEQSSESQDTWLNYHLISDVVKGESAIAAGWDIAGGVAAALESEPSHSVKQVETTVEPLVIESQPTPKQAKKYLPAWLSQFGQVAIAASVTLVVVLGAQQYGASSNGGETATQQSPVLQTVPFSGSVEPVSLNRSSLSNNETVSEAKKLEQRRRINAMLQDYELQLRLTTQAEGELSPQSVIE